MTEPNDRTLDERKFLHDLSSPLTVAQGTVEILLERLKSAQNPSTPEMLLDRMGRVLTALEKMTNLLNQRREVVRSQSND